MACKYEDKGWLKEQYIEKGLTAQEIADKLGVSQATICRRLNKYDIKTRGAHPQRLKIGKEWLKEKYLEERLSMAKVAKLYGCGVSTIKRRVKKFNIPARNGHPGFIIDLTPELKEIIIGSLLGDGSLIPNKNISAYFSYTDKHRDFLKWLSSKLENLGMDQMDFRRRETEIGVTYHYMSRCYRNLLPLRKKWYPNGEKKFLLDLSITPTILFMWYIGDGSYNQNKYVYLYTSRPKKEIEMMKRKLDEKGVVASVKDFGLYIRNDHKDKFFNYLSNCPLNPPAYDYKFPDNH